MADNNQAEQKPQVAEGKKEEKKQPSRLENLVNESSTALNALITAGAIGVSAFLQGIGGPIVNVPYANIPINAGTLSVTASQPLSTIITKEKITSKDLRNDAIYGLLQLPAFDFVTKTALNLSKNYSGLVDILAYSVPAATLAGTAAIVASAPLLTAAYYPIRYFMNKGSFEGFGKSFKDNYVKYTTRTALTWGLTTAAFIYGFGMAPFLAAAAGNLVYRFWSGYADQNPDGRKGFIQYSLKSLLNTARVVTYPVLGAASIVGRAFSGLASVPYSLGSWLSYTTIALPNAKPAAAPKTPALEPQPA